MSEDQDHNENETESPALSSEQQKSKDLKVIHNLYAALTVSIILAFAPSMAIQTLSTILFTGVFIAAYIFRGLAEETTLAWNHITYLIRTIWIGSLFLTIAIIAGATWFYQVGDHSLISLYMQQVSDGMANGYTNNYDVHSLSRDYLDENKEVLVPIAITCAVPCLLYIAYRIVKGLSRALKGYRLKNLDSWF